ncbi:MAG TPA: tetratricopeptide repeat protein, partial [Pyrinomonadaceae bacterium]
MKLGDGKLPPFIGYLPPVVDGTLLELVNMSNKDYPPRRGRTGAQLSHDRKMAIDGLRLFFKERPHQRAMEIMAASMRGRKPFCLYLRNFGLGARLYHSSHKPYGVPQMVTVSTRFDDDMQRRIQSVVSPVVPALCIRNPAAPFAVLPAFIVADEQWEGLAHTLVRNAGLVIMYFFSATSGVVDEMELIRSEGRQDATLLVIEEENPFGDGTGPEVLFGVRRDEPPKVEVPVEDFPHQVRRPAGGGWDAVEAKLAEMARGELRGPVEARIGLPGEFKPSEALCKLCTKVSTEEYAAANKLIGEGKYEEAEDVLTRSLAFAHWGRDTLGRAMTLMALGMVNLKGFNARGDAGAYFEMALEVCEEIR